MTAAESRSSHGGGAYLNLLKENGGREVTATRHRLNSQASSVMAFHGRPSLIE